jgi:hypothetical protein
MNNVWKVSFVLNTFGAGLCLFSGFTLGEGVLIVLGTLNAIYAIVSARNIK